MKRAGNRRVLALGACVLVGASAIAGESANAKTPRDATMALILLRDPRAQRELKLTASQARELNEMASKYDYPLFQLRDLAPTEKFGKLEEIADGVEKSIVKSLKLNQLQRLDQLLLQVEGYPGLLHPNRANALELTDAQRSKMQQLIEEFRKVNNAPTLTPQQRDRIQATFTNDQLRTLGMMTGRQFDLSKVRHVVCLAPEIRDVERWFNSSERTLESLRGRVVAYHFWAYGCSNCVHNLPFYQKWHEDYADKGLTVIGMHTPETSGERVLANLERQVAAKKIPYPVAADMKSANWNAWVNRMWPSVYLIDKRGYVRHWWYGELDWQGAQGEPFLRKKIEELLAEDDDDAPRRQARAN